ncbi:unnamed protein product [Ectocarpus sp. CCAP 1310/34]|nr:unnamed protein product [Ectocarpus sp. CCAP 1310/34]
MSACCSSVGTYSAVILPDLNSSRMKWNRTSMCLLLAELNGFSIKARAPLLSSRTLIFAPLVSGAMNDRTPRTNNASFTLSPAAIYSASEVD